MKELVEAVLNVMEACKGIDKSMTVGSGQSSYKGVSDKDVKLMIGSAMRENGLIILPVDIEPKTTINAYETTDRYGNPTMKQAVFTEVVTTYELIHKSGQSVRIKGYGHGTDPQDKAAGKSTTYAMKYALLYSFMVATGHIDDSDATHSDDINHVAAKPTRKATKKLLINEGKPIIDKARVEAAAKAWGDESRRAAVVKHLAGVSFTDEQWKAITGSDWAGGNTFEG